MSMILHIQTVLDTAHVGFSEKGKLIGGMENMQMREHASFLQPAIHQLAKALQLDLRQLSAIAVVNGPGSYTGIRVGVAGAKGLCYALGLPLIMMNTLQWMALAARSQSDALVCPMIDARRMEVFTALFNTHSKKTILAPSAIILDESFLHDELDQNKIAFFGGGAAKFQSLTTHQNARFPALSAGQEEMAILAWKLYQERVFSDLFHSGPAYFKDFHSRSGHTSSNI